MDIVLSEIKGKKLIPRKFVKDSSLACIKCGRAGRTPLYAKDLPNENSRKKEIEVQIEAIKKVALCSGCIKGTKE